MIKFRRHRGTLEDSLETMQEFDSLMALKQYLENDLDNIGYYGYDERCKQDLWMVTNSMHMPLGFICEDRDEENV